MDYPSSNRLKAVGRALRDGTATPADDHDFELHLQRCDDVLATAQERLQADGFALATPEPCAVQGRLKTRITLLEKLRRMDRSGLADIRDIVGLRVVGALRIDQQEPVARLAMEQMEVPPEDYRLIDRRETPSPGGYRALHVEFRLDGVRGELQVRTARQHVWAEAYERLGDLYGRQIRYETAIEHPQSQVGMMVQAMGELSIGVAMLERVTVSVAEARGWAEAGVLTQEQVEQVLDNDEQLKEAEEAVDHALREMSRLGSEAGYVVQERRRTGRGHA